MKSLVAPYCYFGNVFYFKSLYNSQNILFECFENYTKQTFRNRMQIYAANGIQNLTVPVKKKYKGKNIISDIEISYDEDWQANHLRSIKSAYNNSPFYMYYEDEINDFYQKKHQTLIDLNKASIDLIIEILEIDLESINKTSSYLDYHQEEYLDIRQVMTPKVNLMEEFEQYHQVFIEKYGFIQNLSILDLLFNEGPRTLEVLEK